MKRFLWLVVALAAMVMVGCSNNAGGVKPNKTDQEGLTQDEVLKILEGVWETEGFSSGTYRKMTNPNNPDEYGEFAFQFVYTTDLKTIDASELDSIRTDPDGILVVTENYKFGDTNWMDYYNDKNSSSKSIFYYRDVWQDGDYLINLRESKIDGDVSTMKLEDNVLYIKDLNGEYSIPLRKVKSGSSAVY